MNFALEATQKGPLLSSQDISHPNQKNLEYQQQQQRQQRRQQQPINIVTSTYLDPRKYKKFVNVWAYLGFLGLLQWLQFMWIDEKNKQWYKRIEQWKELLHSAVIDEKYPFQWVDFKKDILPVSADQLLADFASKKPILTPLIEMGSSYIDIPNAIFLHPKQKQHYKELMEDFRKRYDVNQLTSPLDILSDYQVLNSSPLCYSKPNHEIDEDLKNIDNHGDGKTTKKENRSNLTNVRMKGETLGKKKRMGNNEMIEYLLDKLKTSDLKLQEILKMDYKIFEAMTKPVWRSRFIIAPETMPSQEEIDDLLTEEEKKNGIEDDEDPEFPFEFETYLFDEFLHDIDPFIQKKGNLERSRFILNDIERDRERIIREVITQTRVMMPLRGPNT